MSVRELHKSLVSDTDGGGLKYSRYEDDNILISNYTIRSLLPPQLKQVSARYKIVCVCEFCISAKSIHSSLLSWCDRYLKQQKYKNQNSQNRSPGEKVNQIYKRYKNTVMPHVRHI